MPVVDCVPVFQVGIPFIIIKLYTVPREQRYSHSMPVLDCVFQVGIPFILIKLYTVPREQRYSMPVLDCVFQVGIPFIIIKLYTVPREQRCAYSHSMPVLDCVFQVGIPFIIIKPVFRIRIRMDPHSIGRPDPDPHSDSNLFGKTDTDPFP
jgi:Na+(H+)/acetate symporter ActP